MTSEPPYRLLFKKTAKKEWDKLGHTLKQHFKKKLAERLKEPRVPSDKLSGHPDCYKIKLRSADYRLVYQVDDDVVTVTVIAVGRRERMPYITT